MNNSIFTLVRIDAAQWTTAFVNTLPDSSFAYIAPGGEKDSEGKTTPRELRKLPYKDANGKVDMAHCRNALARLPQADIPASKQDSIRKTLQSALDNGKNASAVTQAPSEIQLLMPGEWKTPFHGDFQVTPADLQQYVDNFNELIKSSGHRLPINYEHTADPTKGMKAAGWITELHNRGSDGLWASVEWTPTGAKEVADKEYLYISPEFWPQGWINPQDKADVRSNVLEGAAVTNTPLFTGLSPIAASASKENIIYIKGTAVDLKDLRTKKLADLSDDEKKYLADHSSELTAEERKAFELSTEADKKAEADAEATKKAEEDAAAAKAAEEEAARKEASAKQGTVSISAAELEALKASAKRGEEAHEQLERNRLDSLVKAHVGRGAVKSDQQKDIVDVLLAAAPALRTRLESVFASLPDNKLVTAGELGSSENSNGGISASALNTKAEEYAAKNKVSFSEALKEVSRNEKGLAQTYEKEVTEGAYNK